MTGLLLVGLALVCIVGGIVGFTFAVTWAIEFCMKLIGKDPRG